MGPRAGPSATEPVTLDLDSTHCETYGLGKAGGWKVNRDGVRGYHPQVAVVDGYDQVVATRCGKAAPTTSATGPASPPRSSTGCAPPGQPTR